MTVKRTHARRLLVAVVVLGAALMGWIAVIKFIRDFFSHTYLVIPYSAHNTLLQWTDGPETVEWERHGGSLRQRARYQGWQIPTDHGLQTVPDLGEGVFGFGPWSEKMCLSAWVIRDEKGYYYFWDERTGWKPENAKGYCWGTAQVAGRTVRAQRRVIEFQRDNEPLERLRLHPGFPEIGSFLISADGKEFAISYGDLWCYDLNGQLQYKLKPAPGNVEIGYSRSLSSFYVIDSERTLHTKQGAFRHKGVDPVEEYGMRGNLFPDGKSSAYFGFLGRHYLYPYD